MGFKAQQPAYAGNGIAIWEAVVSKGKNTGQTYFKAKVLGGKPINLFKVEDKE